MKHIKVESCEHCPLRFRHPVGDKSSECMHVATEGMQLDNIKIIHPECPLESLPEWISVKDRLPEIDSDCLVYLKTGQITVDRFRGLHNGEWRYVFNFVTHWQPLPSPPKEDEG